MTPKQEILAITELCMDITDLGQCIHCCATGSTAISITAFRDDNEIDWQQNIYEWSIDEAFLPKLRFVRNELEKIYQEALIKRQEAAE